MMKRGGFLSDMVNIIRNNINKGKMSVDEGLEALKALKVL